MSYFSPQTDPKIDFEKIDLDSLAMLEEARDSAGVPFRISCSYRSPEHSIAVGGKSNDAHTRIPCTAFDVIYTSHPERSKIIFALVMAGFRRVGVNEKNGHIHVDNEKSLPLPAFWIE